MLSIAQKQGQTNTHTLKPNRGALAVKASVVKKLQPEKTMNNFNQIHPMRKKFQNQLGLFRVLIALVCGLPLPMLADNIQQSVLTHLHKSLTDYAAAMNDFHLVYTETETGLGAPQTSERPLTNEVYFKSNSFYIIMQIMPNRDESIRIHEEAFDGSTYFIGDRSDTPETIAPVMQKYTPGDQTDPDQKTEIFSLADSYIEAAGFNLPKRIFDLNTFNAIESSLLVDLNESDSTKIQTESNLLVITVHVQDPFVLRARALDLDRFRRDMEDNHIAAKNINTTIDTLNLMRDMDKWHHVIYTVDPQMGYGIVSRQDYSPDGRLFSSIVSEKWSFFSKIGVWLPTSSTKSYYAKMNLYTNFSESPRLVIRYNLIDVSDISGSNISFALNYHYPYTMIVDHSTQRAKSGLNHQAVHSVGADELILNGEVKSAANEMAAPSKHVIFAVILCVSSVAGLVIAVLIGKKTKRE